MKQQELLSRLEYLIKDGESVRTTAKKSRSGQMFVDREFFTKWETSCLEYLENFKDKPYLEKFKKDVKGRLLPNIIRGLGILRSLKGALQKGYISIEEEKVEKPEVDIHSRSEVINYVLKLLKKGQIKDCQHMKVKKDLVDSFYPECDENWASKPVVFGMGTIFTYGGEACYYWPNCGKDCPIYNKAENFVESLISTKKAKVEKLEVDNYVDEGRIKELASLPKDKFDTTKLVELCEELNQNYKWKNYFAVGALLRTILHHVPPIFEKVNFEQVANNYSWGVSHKKLMMKLYESAKNIADNLLHTIIKKNEVLPKKQRVDFKAELDILLAEIVAILKT
jgi:hypothetical protein